MAAGPSGAGNAEAASGHDMGRNPDRGDPRNPGGGKKDFSNRRTTPTTKPKSKITPKPKTKKKKNFGWQPTPNIEDDPLYDPTEDWRTNVDQYRSRNGIGKYSGRNKDYGRKVPDHILQGLNPAQRKATAELVAPRRGLGNTFGNFFSGLFGQSFAKADLTIDDAGQVAYEETVNPAGYALDRFADGVPVGGIVSAGLGVSDFFGGPGVPGGITSTTSAEKVDQRADANRASRQRSGASVGNHNAVGSGSLGSGSLFDRAQNQLYPQATVEENKPQFGVGVTTGVSKVRRGPALSGLNRRRAIYGRVY